ncbi:hypothetical protein SMACR_08681 [Sordaria macrospora]|uniref:Uncharacterized protein n=1 Tax=Sordaria macrospora TaxID=5147 RepID=A0A8S8ZG07_SORMA|nr:hypothetical protein SMACR_08681 [Sordaria macrospora]KAH7635358.1 hypothetical protein B0T09DRAFT_389671 [Sordaria sp. MPI-SDFR-AT-0083]WPJ67296.1 hypothetical protein SMAC4_08681 [Sordaria macrospora]
MQFSTILLSAIAFFAGAEACKCLNSGGGFNKGASEACCHQQNGSWRNGNDCAASSISEHLSNFRSCCKNSGAQTSDCDYPRLAAADANDGIMAAPVVDGIAIATIVQKNKRAVPTSF